MSEDKQKRLNLMRYWLFGIWAIVFAAVTAYIGLFTFQDPFAALRAGLPIWGITAVLAVIWYFGYRWWLLRSPDTAPATTAGSSPPPPEAPMPPAPSDEGEQSSF